VAGMGYPKVCGVPADEDAPVAEAVGHEATADPVLLRDQLVAKIRFDAEDRTDGPITIDRIEFELPVGEGIVDEPRLPHVDRDRAAAAAWIEREVQPGGFSGQEVQELRRADIG